MKNELVTKIMKEVNEHLPGIMVVGGIFIGVATVAYSIYAGYKIKEIAEDDTKDTKQKAKEIAIVSIPVAIGTIASSACEIGAHKEQAKRYAAIGTLIAAGEAKTLINKDDVKKVKKLVTGKDDKDTKVLENVKANEIITIEDCETGFTFQTTLKKFMEQVVVFNNRVTSVEDTYPISEFYKSLLGDGYDETFSAHEKIKFGMNYNGTVIFQPEFTAMLTEDLKPIYGIMYNYINR